MFRLNLDPPERWCERDLAFQPERTLLVSLLPAFCRFLFELISAGTQDLCKQQNSRWISVETLDNRQICLTNPALMKNRYKQIAKRLMFRRPVWKQRTERVCMHCILYSLVATRSEVSISEHSWAYARIQPMLTKKFRAPPNARTNKFERVELLCFPAFHMQIPEIKSRSLNNEWLTIYKLIN